MPAKSAVDVLALSDPFVELDFHDAALDPHALAELDPALRRALAAMVLLEGGAIANPTEQRMVGHYWLRAPALAPDAALADQIVDTLDAVRELAQRVLTGELAPPEGGRFETLLLCGIGGSSLGPMLLADALGAGPVGANAQPRGLKFVALDNTDPDGFRRVLDSLGKAGLRSTLCLVISKSGGTPETRNGMLEVRRAIEAAGLDFAARAVAITGEGSKLAQIAQQDGWLASLPMWDWVGGRTSVCSAVGLLPAALLGHDVLALLAGAAAMDVRTRAATPKDNPAAMLAAFWFLEGGGRGARDMVVLPYADRLLLMSRYLQQLVMESLGKRLDRQGREVSQGLAVYGNKGSTDQHAYVQQLRDGLHNFFALFVRVLGSGALGSDGAAAAQLEVEPGVTSGDYLNGFCLGTRRALAEGGRHSATINIARIDERTLGALIALFERAVGIYAELIDVNAYDQPGVEAGKRAAGDYLALQARVLAALDARPRSATELAAALSADPRDVFELCRHLAAARPGRVRQTGEHDLGSARFVRLG